MFSQHLTRMFPPISPTCQSLGISSQKMIPGLGSRRLSARRNRLPRLHLLLLPRLRLVRPVRLHLHHLPGRRRHRHPRQHHPPLRNPNLLLCDALLPPIRILNKLPRRKIRRQRFHHRRNPVPVQPRLDSISPLRRTFHQSFLMTTPQLPLRNVPKPLFRHQPRPRCVGPRDKLGR